MTIYVPAWAVTQMREYRVDAGLRLGLACVELGLAAFLWHCVNLVDLHDAQRVVAEFN